MKSIDDSFCHIMPNGEKRMTYTGLKASIPNYTDKVRVELQQGKNAKFNNVMNLERINLLLFPTEHERKESLIELLEAIRQQDIEKYGIEGAAFSRPMQEVFGTYDEIRADEIVEEKCRKCKFLELTRLAELGKI